VSDMLNGELYTTIQDDCIEVMEKMPRESFDLAVFSPPFGSLYAYSGETADIGNSHEDDGEFKLTMSFFWRHLFDVMRTGRIVCCHIAQVVYTKRTFGREGLRDLRGLMIRLAERAGFWYHGEAGIQKNPQCLKNGTPVLTPNGWVRIEDIQVGDSVIGSNGKPTKVTCIPYKGKQLIYHVEFRDGASVDCGPEHLWAVRSSSSNPWIVTRTDDMEKIGTYRLSGELRYEIPITQPVDMPSADLPIHPRLLGALLADGNWANQRCVSITKDKCLVEALPLPKGHRVVIRPGSERASGRTATYGITCKDWHQNDILVALRELGLEDCRGWEKFIPEVYK